MKEENQNGNLCKLLLTVHTDDGRWFLGCKVEQDIPAGTVRLSQEKYCNDILKRFQISDANPVSTPMETNAHLCEDDCPP